MARKISPNQMLADLSTLSSILDQLESGKPLDELLLPARPQRKPRKMSRKKMVFHAMAERIAGKIGGQVIGWWAYEGLRVLEVKKLEGDWHEIQHWRLKEEFATETGMDEDDVRIFRTGAKCFIYDGKTAGFFKATPKAVTWKWLK